MRQQRKHQKTIMKSVKEEQSKRAELKSSRRNNQGVVERKMAIFLWRLTCQDAVKLLDTRYNSSLSKNITSRKEDREEFSKKIRRSKSPMQLPIP